MTPQAKTHQCACQKSLSLFLSALVVAAFSIAGLSCVVPAGSTRDRANKSAAAFAPRSTCEAFASEALTQHMHPSVGNGAALYLYDDGTGFLGTVAPGALVNVHHIVDATGPRESHLTGFQQHQEALLTEGQAEESLKGLCSNTLLSVFVAEDSFTATDAAPNREAHRWGYMRCFDLSCTNPYLNGAVAALGKESERVEQPIAGRQCHLTDGTAMRQLGLYGDMQAATDNRKATTVDFTTALIEADHGQLKSRGKTIYAPLVILATKTATSRDGRALSSMFLDVGRHSGDASPRASFKATGSNRTYWTPDATLRHHSMPVECPAGPDDLEPSSSYIAMLERIDQDRLTSTSASALAHGPH